MATVRKTTPKKKAPARKTPAAKHAKKSPVRTPPVQKAPQKSKPAAKARSGNKLSPKVPVNPGTPPRAPGTPLQIRPQPGPQEDFLSSDADIAIYGGAAFAGKTFAMLLEPTRHIDNPLFRGVIFRRETPQIRNPGGLWDESMGLYPKLGSDPVASFLQHTFPSGAQIKFAHLEHKDTVYDWDGAQVPFFGFDQLEHFDEFQFFYMLSRNRSASGIRAYIRATCNPNPDSFLATFLAWWIDQETGYPIPERAGKTRWMLREGDQIMWFDTLEAALASTNDPDVDPKSVAFFPGTIQDNQIGMKNDPGYLGNLKAMQRVERERLLGGNWKIRPSAGLMFRREWCETIDIAPADTQWVRYWDLAATKPSAENPDPDWTVGVKLGYSYKIKKYILAAAARDRDSPGAIRDLIRNTATADDTHTRVGIPQDPGQAGKDQAQGLIKHLDGFSASSRIESGDKVVRFSPFSAQAEAGNVLLLRGLSEDFLRGLESFPDGKHKDDADACSGAYAMFQEGRGMGLFEYMRQQYEEAEAEKAKANGHMAAPVIETPPEQLPGHGGRNIMEAYGRRV